MTDIKKSYEEKVKTAKEALDLIKDGDYIFSAQATAEPIEIMSNLQHLKETRVKGCVLDTYLPPRDYDYLPVREMNRILEHHALITSAVLRKSYEDKIVSTE